MSSSAKKIFVLVMLAFAAASAPGQALPDSVIKKIDRLFLDHWPAEGPGGAFAIVRNDSLVCAKGYGMANLEYLIPNTPQTIFHIASLAKQFTGYSILLLAQQGKLNLDDDIRKYLPWFPDLKVKITIRNLLNHTSGIRDQWQLLTIAGTRTDDVITQEHVIRVMEKQTALNFQPGEHHLYSNSNYTLLAEIVKTVSHQSFRAFTDSAIFKPLGMCNTHFNDDYTEIVKNRASSYSRIDSLHFSGNALNYATVGATNLLCPVSDMSKWMMNLYQPKIGNAETIRLLAQTGTLSNGATLTYAAGITVDTYNGWKRYSQSGRDAGFNSAFTVFPDAKTGIAVFGNVEDMSAMSIAAAIADLLLPQGPVKTETITPVTRDSAKTILTDTLAIKNVLGTYFSDEGQQRDVVLKNGKLYVVSNSVYNLMYPEEKNIFSVYKYPEVRYIFSTDPATKMMAIERSYKWERTSFYKYKEVIPAAKQDLMSIAGTYFCPELECSYRIFVKNNELYLSNNKYGETKLTLKSADFLSDDFWWMAHLRLLRNAKKEITGFEVNTDRIAHLAFRKID